MEVVEWNKRWSPPSPGEFSVSMKENPDRKKYIYIYLTSFLLVVHCTVYKSTVKSNCILLSCLCTRVGVNLHYIVAWMSNIILLETGAISEV